VVQASAIYAAMKGPTVTLSHAFNEELGPRGVTVNTIAPCIIETEMTSVIIPE
jgi:3-oxoacyl-[acyl-carrier protein] reductase